jgi:AcrR family transcriptional regulator
MTRSRDSTRTRQDLLAAAAELFGTRGYERTTIREIGERAGADPALIARYFGNKAALYIATLPAENDEVEQLGDISEPRRIDDALRRMHDVGPSPVLHAVMRAHDDPAVQAAASERVDKRLTAGVQERMTADGLDEPRLRAQLAVAALAGIAMGRSSGTLDALAEADHDDVVALTTAVLGSLLQA